MGRVVRVLPDVAALDREFDYSAPPALAGQVTEGSVVRVVLAGRRVRAWVTALDAEPPAGVVLSPLSRVSGWGPPPELISLAGWAAWRWAGQRVHFLRIASPPLAVRSLPPPARTAPPARTPLPARTPAPAGEGPDVAPAGAVAAGAVAAGAVAGAAGAAVGAASMVVSAAEMADLCGEALAGGSRVLRLPPAADPTPVVLAAVARGAVLVLVPAVARAAILAGRLRRSGRRVALLPGDWAQARAGADVVVGARAAAWAPCPSLAAVVVVDAHDEAYSQEGAPTWDAVAVAQERARRSGVPCVLVTATPTLQAAGPRGPVPAPVPVVRPSQAAERRGWAPLEIIDRRGDDPRLGLWSVQLVRAVTGSSRVACVLNRRGRARLLACRACGELARCERCGAAVSEAGAGPRQPRRAVAELACPRCGTVRPGLCAACGSTVLKRMRVGVTGAAEELAALVGRPVQEVSGPAPGRAGRAGGGQGDSLGVPRGREAGTEILIGTEAVLHRTELLDTVVFVDFDQELLAPRYRAGEDALAMLGRAARLVGGRRRGGRILVQTRLPGHLVLAAAAHADYERWAAAERELRAELGLPPFASLARLSGDAAADYAAGLLSALDAGGSDAGVQILGPADGQWLVKAPTSARLADVLARVPRPATGRLRVEVAPRRV